MKKTDPTRPIKFSLKSSTHVTQVLRNARRLRTKEGFQNVYICHDRTVEDRKALKKLEGELEQKSRTELAKLILSRTIIPLALKRKFFSRAIC